MSKKDNLLEALLKNSIEHKRLVDELCRSVALTELWPECFDNGKVITSWVTNSKGHLGRMIVKDGAGTEREFDARDVPDVLKY